MNENKIKKTLEYLYKLEFFSPFTPTGEKIYDSEKHKKFYQIDQSEKHENFKYNYIYYIGDFHYQNAITKIRELTQDDYNENYFSSKSSICGFKLNDQGEYIPNTFSICRFIYAVHKILEQNRIDLSFEEEEIAKIEKQIESKLIKYSSFTENTIQEIFKTILEYFPCIKEDCHLHIQVYKEKLKKNEEPEEGPTILSSFYLKDLMQIKEEPSMKIQEFLSLNKINRIEIDKNISEMRKILSPKNYPLGKWPSKYHPSLMQQIAINLFTHYNLSKDIFSVNGPPGSGKTTLVKEVIASLLVEKAIKICDYQNPDDAFTKESIANSNDRFYRHFYKLDPSLAKYSILIASNNNTAVENISLELPMANKVRSDNTLTNLFDTKEQEEIYFTSLANNFKSSKENWGFISARLGRNRNIREFLSAIWFTKDQQLSLSSYIKDNDIDFSACKTSFLKKLKEVKEYQAFLEKVQNKTFLLESNQKELDELEGKIKTAKEQLKSLKQAIEEINHQIIKHSNRNQKYESLIKDVKEKIPWYQKLFFFFFRSNSKYLKIKELKDKIEENNDIIFKSKIEMISIEEQIEKHVEKKKLLEQQQKNLIYQMNILEQELQKYSNNDKIVIADSKFYENISLNKSSQESCPWTNEKYDTLREELFALALQLQKAFILNSKGFSKNMNLLVNIWSNNCDDNIKRQVYKDAFSTLFLFVPVISTALASVQKFLSEIKENELGYLIIDEAGQATPASVLGAIDRCQKTIMLGDPFQIEPVTTIPKELYRILDVDKEIPSLFYDATLSAQILADIQNNYGSFREEDWVGSPLIIHRRCIEPMFSITNKIAYNDKMICCTKDDSASKKLSMKKSCWIDIRGESLSKGNHFINEQAEKLLELLIHAIKVNHNQLPNLYIITPFKDVVEKTKKFLLKELPKIKLQNSSKEIEEWLKENCGTIHTFQGKEADEVIIILGCDKKNKGAVSWASKKPNILNVAVSRAKYRLTIIGDKDLWNVPYFDIAYQLLEKNKKGKDDVS